MKLVGAVLSLFILAVLFKPTLSDLKAWVYSNDILNHNNWINKADCLGLEFPEEGTWSYETKMEIRLKSITLPINGEISLDTDISIDFDEASKEEINCVTLKSINHASWLNMNGWNSTDEPDNPAVPYVYRIPTRFDEVVIPDGSLTNIDLDGAIFKSLMYGSKKISTENAYSLNANIGDYKITNVECTDPTGCGQRLSTTQVWKLCESVSDVTDPLNCDMPLKLLEFCFIPKCGGIIRVQKYQPGFSLERIRQKLKEYQSYSYAYKSLSYRFLEESSEIHIFFTEKQFTGNSLLDATEFYHLIKSDASYYCSEITLELSGPPRQENAILIKNMFSTIFGSLLLVCLIFGLLFFMYSPVAERVNIRNRILGSRPLSTFRMRYNNIDEIASVVDEQSMAGSTVNLRTAFENPMYDHLSSSRSTSQETITSVIDTRQEDLEIETNKEADAELQKSDVTTGKPLVEDIPDDKEDLLLNEL
ncbi:uncharacterized protein LOC126750682 [Anthonomus grandis grandis]|uniref:uncharacterized protein LOC126750682 n=1 Tax=Anthonomus grandis grandis TaxID=2921223 RepID=UPI0021663BCD|nr:uncharacterized protein LOC126750682 [Anthonomus grandis grandis]